MINILFAVSCVTRAEKCDQGQREQNSANVQISATYAVQREF